MSGCGPCKGGPPASASTIKDADYTLALFGNANVGKSVIFNQLHGVDQIIGN
jgi:tRNA U34 5-carboxymethylaminomethyl modifying GTPase MnmE/TrmE